MLDTLHNHAVVVVVDRLEVKSSSSRRSNWRSHDHIHHAWCPADGPAPQKGRRCSPGSVWAAVCATLVFPICGFDPYIT